MKTKITLALLIIFSTAHSQSVNIEIYNEMFKWNFSIPSYFENVSPQEAAKNKAIGKEIIESKVGHEIVNKSIKIYGFKSGDFNQLIVNYERTESEENYSEKFKQISEILHESFKKKFPDAEINRSNSSEIISNIKFEVFDITISSENTTIMNMKCFSAIIDKKTLNIQIVYKDKEKGQALISSFRKSIFKK
jgi:hypothetical protein